MRGLKRARDPAVYSRSNYPDYITPCLATDIGRPPAGEKWVHEIKLDGFRSQLHLRNGEVTIYSRGGHDWTERYYSVADQAAQLSAKHLVIDGEMVVLREDGTCDFWAFQKGARGSISDRVTYFAVDLLYQGGEDLRRRPFLERKELLRKALKTSFDRIRYVEHFEADGPTVWAHAHKINVEGIVSKRIDSPYRSARGADWIKTPCQYRETLLVAGVAFEGADFHGLYLARRKNGALLYAGKVEDGFTDETVARLRVLLNPARHPYAAGCDSPQTECKMGGTDREGSHSAPWRPDRRARAPTRIRGPCRASGKARRSVRWLSGAGAA